jgi:hypothetical protein
MGVVARPRSALEDGSQRVTVLARLFGRLAQVEVFCASTATVSGKRESL